MAKTSKATGIKTWPEDDRPREKLLKKGAKRLIFIGYSFPQMDYETVVLLNLATKHSGDRDCHICVKGENVPICDIPCKKLVYYRNGMEDFLEDYKDE